MAGTFYIKEIPNDKGESSGDFGLWLPHQIQFLPNEKDTRPPLRDTYPLVFSDIDLPSFRKSLDEINGDKSGEKPYVLKPGDKIIIDEGSSIIFKGQKDGNVQLAMCPKTFAGISLEGNTLTAKTSLEYRKAAGLQLVETTAFGTGVAVEVIDNTARRLVSNAANDSMVQAEIRRIMEDVAEAVTNNDAEKLEALGFSKEEAAKYAAKDANIQVEVPRSGNMVQQAQPQRAPGAPKITMQLRGVPLSQELQAFDKAMQEHIDRELKASGAKTPIPYVNTPETRRPVEPDEEGKKEYENNARAGRMPYEHPENIPKDALSKKEPVSDDIYKQGSKNGLTGAGMVNLAELNAKLDDAANTLQRFDTDENNHITRLEITNGLQNPNIKWAEVGASFDALTVDGKIDEDELNAAIKQLSAKLSSQSTEEVLFKVDEVSLLATELNQKLPVQAGKKHER